MSGERMESSENGYLGPANQTWAIFLVSLLGLFLEMLLMRWIGTEIRIFAYLQNTILVVCFLGLGLGCFTCRQPMALRQMLIPLAFLVLLLAVPLIRGGLGKISELLSVLGDLVIWNQAVSTSVWESLLFVVLGLATTYFVLILIVDIFVSIGRLLGRRSEPLLWEKATSPLLLGSVVTTTFSWSFNQVVLLADVVDRLARLLWASPARRVAVLGALVASQLRLWLTNLYGDKEVSFVWHAPALATIYWLGLRQVPGLGPDQVCVGET